MISKIWSVLSIVGRDGIGKILFLMISGALLETLSVGVIVPFLGVIVSDNAGERFPLILEVIPAAVLSDKNTLLIAGMLTMVMLYLFKSAYLSYQIWQQSKFTYNIHSSLSSRLFEEYLTKPFLFHLEKNSAELYRNVVTESAHFTMGLNAALWLVAETFVVIGIGLLLFLINPIGTISVIIVMSVTAWMYHVVTNKLLHQWGKNRQHHDRMRIKQVQQGLGAIKDILMYGKEGFFIGNYSHHVDEAMSSIARIVTMQQMPRLLLESVAMVSLSLVVIVNVLSNSDIMQLLPIVAVFAAAAFRIMPSVNRVMGAMQTLSSEGPTIQLVHDELATDNENSEILSTLKSGSEVVELNNDIQIKGVYFRYPGSSESILSNIDVLIGRGQMIGIVGESGSGKSTLINILLGLLVPVNGDIYVDGKSVVENMRPWQNMIGYVPQEIFLVDDSLRNNIAFGVDEDAIDDALVMSAIKQSSLIDFVNGQADGVDVNVGERGAKISGGQKQRIGIARALYHNPQVLIFDEATSALDEKTEEEIVQTINRLRGELTIIIVTHRLSTIRHCDDVYKMNNGSLMKLDQ